jgi:RNA polymerase sigma factor for flagellar operon FliA
MSTRAVPSDAPLALHLPLPAGASSNSPLRQAAQTGLPYAPTPRSAREQEEFVLRYMPEVHRIARGILRRLPRSVELDDLVQAGSMGLIDAARRFGPRHHLPFRQYARIRISGAIFDSLRELDWASRYFRTRQQKLANATRDLESKLGRTPDSEELAESLGMDLDSFYEFAQAVTDHQEVEFEAREESERPSAQESIADDAEKRPDALLQQKQSRRQMRRSIAQLPADEANVLMLYYFKDWTMARIARSIGKTESRVSQIHAQAVRHLRENLGPRVRHLAARTL